MKLEKASLVKDFDFERHIVLCHIRSFERKMFENIVYL